MASQYRDMGQNSALLVPNIPVDWIQPFDISDWKDLQYQIDVVANNCANGTDVTFTWYTAMSLDGFVYWRAVNAAVSLTNVPGATIYTGDLGCGMTANGLTNLTLVPWARFAKLVVKNVNASNVSCTLKSQFILKERTT